MAETEKDSQGQPGAGGPGTPTGDAGTPAQPAAPAAQTGQVGAGQSDTAKPAEGGEPAIEQIPSGIPDVPPAVWESEKNPLKKRLSDTQRSLTERSERLKTLEAENAELKAKATAAPATPDSRTVAEPTHGEVQGYSDEEFLRTCTVTLDQWKQDAIAQAQQQTDMTGVTVSPQWPTQEARRFAATMDGELSRRGIPQPWSLYGMLVKRSAPALPAAEVAPAAAQTVQQEPVDVEARISDVLNLREQVNDGMQSIATTYPQGFLQQKVMMDGGRTSTLGAVLKQYCLELKEPNTDRVLAMYFTGFRDRAREQMVAAKLGQRPGTAAGQQYTGVRTNPIPEHDLRDDAIALYESVGMSRGGTSVRRAEDDADWERAPSPEAPS